MGFLLSFQLQMFHAGRLQIRQPSLVAQKEMSVCKIEFVTIRILTMEVVVTIWRVVLMLPGMPVIQHVLHCAVS